MKKYRTIGLLAGFLLAGTAWGDTTQQNIVLSGHGAPISNNLSTYMGTLGKSKVEPFVGFKGYDLGYGQGDGDNEAVPFSFYFQPVQRVYRGTAPL